MYCAILPINVRIDMIYLLGLCYFTKLSNICHHDLLKVLKHPIRIDRLIDMTFEKQQQSGARIPYKNTRSQQRTWPNTWILSKPSIHKYCESPQAIHNYCEPSQMKPVAILYPLCSWQKRQLWWGNNCWVISLDLFYDRVPPSLENSVDQWAAKAQAICVDSAKHSLLAYTKNRHWWRLTPNFRPLVPLIMWPWAHL